MEAQVNLEAEDTKVTKKNGRSCICLLPQEILRSFFLPIFRRGETRGKPRSGFGVVSLLFLVRFFF